MTAQATEESTVFFKPFLRKGKLMHFYQLSGSRADFHQGFAISRLFAFILNQLWLGAFPSGTVFSFVGRANMISELVCAVSTSRRQSVGSTLSPRPSQSSKSPVMRGRGLHGSEPLGTCPILLQRPRVAV